MGKENSNKLVIKEWASEDRPREKLLEKGVTSLSNAELLAILIGSGNREENAVDLSKKILNQHNNSLTKLGRTTIHELCKIKGIGNAKAISIVAAIELGKRRNSMNGEQLPKITASSDAFKVISSYLIDIHHEEFWCLYLNRANEVIHKEKISQGGISGTVMDIRLIIKKGVEVVASSIIVAHNHPSGNTSPSREDIATTNKLKEAAQIMDIPLLDHLIIGGNKYYSFADNGEI